MAGFAAGLAEALVLLFGVPGSASDDEFLTVHPDCVADTSPSDELNSGKFSSQ